MKIRIKLLKPLSNAVGKNEVNIDFKGFILEELLKTLIEQYPKLENEFFIGEGHLTDYINIFINDKPISALQGLKSKIQDGDVVLLFIPLSGG